MGMYYACICFLGDGHGCTYDDRFIHSKKTKKRKSYLDLLFHISTKTVIISVPKLLSFWYSALRRESSGRTLIRGRLLHYIFVTIEA